MELRLLAAALRRRLLVLLLAAITGAAVAALVLASQTGTYRATSTLLLDPLAVTTPLGEPFVGDPERYIGGQMRILQGRDLADAAAELVPGEDADSLSRAVEVTHVVGSDVVDVTAEAADARTAQALANAVPQTYVDRRKADTAAQVEAVVTAVNADVAAVEASLAALRGTGPAVDSQRQVLLAQYQQVLDRRRDVTAPDAVRDATRILDVAPLPEEPQRLPEAATIAAGAVLGALLMLAVAVLVEALRPRVTNRRQLERLLDTPVLISFDRIRSRSGAAPRRIERLLPRARTLASLIALGPSESKRRVVVVCGVTRQAGASTVSMALAAAFADQGSNVVVLQGAGSGTAQGHDEHGVLPADTSLATPVGHEVARRRRQDLVGERGWADEGRLRLQDTEWADVSTLAWSGERPANAEDLAALLEGLPPVHDVVVLDLPPVLESPLPATVCDWAQDVVLLVRMPHEEERDVEIAHGMLAGTRPDLRLVVVPNQTPRRRSSRL